MQTELSERTVLFVVEEYIRKVGYERMGVLKKYKYCDMFLYRENGKISH